MAANVPSSWNGPILLTFLRTLVRPRADFDQLLARHAVAAGATLYELSNVVEPIIDPRTDRVVGVRTKDGRRFTAPIVVAADGNSTRLSLAMGLSRRDGPAHGRRRTHLLHEVRVTATITWSPGWSSGKASPGRAHCYLDMGGSLAWATVPATSVWES